MTVSLGVAVSSPGQHEADGIEGLIGRAHQALYRAKEGGRDQVVIDEEQPATAGTRSPS